MSNEKKTRTIQLGSIKKGQYGAYISFDKDIKSITIEREYETKGETISQKVKIPLVEKNGKTYLGAANIAKVADDVAFRVEQGWLEADKGEKIIENAQEYGTTSYIKVKVENA